MNFPVRIANYMKLKLIASVALCVSTQFFWHAICTSKKEFYERNRVRDYFLASTFGIYRIFRVDPDFHENLKTYIRRKIKLLELYWFVPLFRNSTECYDFLSCTGRCPWCYRVTFPYKICILSRFILPLRACDDDVTHLHRTWTENGLQLPRQYRVSREQLTHTMARQNKIITIVRYVRRRARVTL